MDITSCFRYISKKSKENTSYHNIEALQGYDISDQMLNFLSNNYLSF